MSEFLAKENRKSFFLLIFLAYRDFSLSYKVERERLPTESWLLFLCFTATLILFLANLPYQIAKWPSFMNGNMTNYIGLLGFIAVFFMPLFLYLLATILFFILKCFKGRGSFYEIRLAVFWSINVAGPILLINGVLKGFFFQSENFFYLSLTIESLIAWIFANMLTEAEQFSSKYPIFLTAVFFVVSPQLILMI